MKLRITIDVEFSQTGMDNEDLFLSIIDKRITEAINDDGFLHIMNGTEIKDWLQDYEVNPSDFTEFK